MIHTEWNRQSFYKAEHETRSSRVHVGNCRRQRIDAILDRRPYKAHNDTEKESRKCCDNRYTALTGEESKCLRQFYLIESVIDGGCKHTDKDTAKNTGL